MVHEWKFKRLSAAVEHGDKAMEAALLLVIDVVPCILHMENCMGLKLFTMLLIDGLAMPSSLKCTRTTHQRVDESVPSLLMYRESVMQRFGVLGIITGI